MRVDEFDFHLPERLIAQFPTEQRTKSRLLVAQNNHIADHHFDELANFLRPNDVLVRNNTKVIPARLFGQKQTGGKVEVLVERVLSPTHLHAMVKASKTPTIGSELILDNSFTLQVEGRERDFFCLKLISHSDIWPLLQNHGHIPLPPYISREDKHLDQERYQTVYAKTAGAVAAPTAGLHFDQRLFSRLKDNGVGVVDLTLHVGAGTFQPVRVEDTDDHHMHHEWFHISKESVAAILKAKQQGGRVVAIGTTSLRALESASRSGTLQAMIGDTDIFITPGFDFHTVDMLVTNFHLPKSTLMMLVSAFAGMDTIQHAYQHAITEQYRFFSYGDAMLLHRI